MTNQLQQNLSKYGLTSIPTGYSFDAGGKLTTNNGQEYTAPTSATPSGSGTSLIDTNPSKSPVVTAPSGANNNPLSIVGPVASSQQPTPPSMTSILNEAHIPTLQTNLQNLQNQAATLQSQYQNYILSLNGNGVPQGIVDIETDATAKNMQMQLNTLNATIQAGQNSLNNALTYVQLSQSAQSTDYTNAVNSYQQNFNNALSLQQVVNSQANTNQQNSAAFLSTISGLITSGSMNPAQLPATTKAQIAAAELQAGWPVGTIENFTQMKPGSNIVGSVNSVNANGQQVTTLIHQNADGSYGMTNITMPGSPVSLFGVLPSGGSGNNGSNGTNGYNGQNPAFSGIDTTQPLSSALSDPTQLAALFAGMNAAEGGGTQAGSQFNNPLDLEYNDYTASLGATNSGGQTSSGIPLAAFPDQTTAESVYQQVLSSPAYQGLTVDQALQKWSGYNGGTSSSSSSGSNGAVQSYVTNIQNGNATLTNVPVGLRTAVSQALANTPTTTYSPLAASRFSVAANRIVSNYISMPAYQLTAGGQLYLGRIAAAMQTPGSISDQDLLDSLTKLNTGGNAISDAQVSLITNGQSFSDWVSVLSNKLGTGGVLSDDQRNQIQTLAQNIYKSYQTAYQPIYDQATKQLQAAGIPQAFWTIPNLSDLNSMSQSATTNTQSVQDQAASAGYDYSAMIAAGYTDSEIQAAIASSTTQ